MLCGMRHALLQLLAALNPEKFCAPVSGCRPLCTDAVHTVHPLLGAGAAEAGKRDARREGLRAELLSFSPFVLDLSIRIFWSSSDLHELTSTPEPAGFRQSASCIGGHRHARFGAPSHTYHVPWAARRRRPSQT